MTHLVDAPARLCSWCRVCFLFTRPVFKFLCALRSPWRRFNDSTTRFRCRSSRRPKGDQRRGQKRNRVGRFARVGRSQSDSEGVPSSARRPRARSTDSAGRRGANGQRVGRPASSCISPSYLFFCFFFFVRPFFQADRRPTRQTPRRDRSSNRRRRRRRRRPPTSARLFFSFSYSPVPAASRSRPSSGQLDNSIMAVRIKRARWYWTKPKQVILQNEEKRNGRVRIDFCVVFDNNSNSNDNTLVYSISKKLSDLIFCLNLRKHVELFGYKPKVKNDINLFNFFIRFKKMKFT